MAYTQYEYRIHFPKCVLFTISLQTTGVLQSMFCETLQLIGTVTCQIQMITLILIEKKKNKLVMERATRDSRTRVGQVSIHGQEQWARSEHLVQ